MNVLPHHLQRVTVRYLTGKGGRPLEGVVLAKHINGECAVVGDDEGHVIEPNAPIYSLDAVPAQPAA